MARYWKIPFGTSGDKITLPETLQPDGSISAPSGWGPNYEKADTEPGYLPVSRTGMNGVLFDVTDAIKELQDFGAPLWTALAAPYAINAQVRHNNVVWRSLVANNSVTPVQGTSWASITTLPAASETVAGIIEIATQAETNTGTDNTRAITPAKLKTYVDTRIPGTASETVAGIIEIATQAETNTGTDDSRAVTPLKLKTYVSAQAAGQASETAAGIAEIATQAETLAGTDNQRIVTPLRLKESFNSPTFTGDPKVPTPAAADNDTSIASTAFVRAAMARFGIGIDIPQLVANLDISRES